LDTIPGVGRQTAEVLAAEIGLNMSQFPSDRHLASWAGMAPGNNLSAGKSKGGKTRKGSKYLRRALIEAAHAAARTKGTYLAAQYRRLKVRRGAKKAAVAVGHAILVSAYHLLARKETYHDLDPNEYTERRRLRLKQHAVEQLQALGYEVTLSAPAPAA